jgi:predicted O-methyltransferase YrrM
VTMSTGYDVDEQIRIVTREAMRRRAYQKAYEFERLVELVADREPASILEIGTAEGGTLYAWARIATPDAVITSIDWAPELNEPCVSEAVLESYCEPGQTAVIIRADSRLETTRDQAVAAAPDGYDFLFIDGDHRLETVTRDHDLYAPLVKPGGLVAFHDIIKPPIRKLDHQRPTEVDLFWDAYTKPGRVWEFVDYSDATWGGIGVYEKP